MSLADNLLQRTTRKRKALSSTPAGTIHLWMPHRLSTMRHHFLREQGHGLPDHGVVHDPTLIEIANELVHAVLTKELLHPVYAIIGIAEYPNLAVEVFVLHTLEPGQDLAKGLESLDVGLAEGSVQPRSLTQKRSRPASQSWRACVRLAATWTGKASATSPVVPLGSVSR